MFNFVTDEHRMVREAVQKVLADLRAQDTTKRQHDNTRIKSAAIGRALAELGLFGTDADDVPMSSAQVQAIVAMEAGAAALPYPVTESLAAHALVLRAAGSTFAQRSAIRTLSGGTCAPRDLPVLEYGRLRGVAHLVTFASLADRLILQARNASEVILVDVDLRAAEISRQPRSSVETDYPVEDLQLDGVPAAPLAGSADAAFLQQRLALLAAAEIAGACRQMVAMTREYLLVRSQFGKVLGSNQALKHKLADNHVRVEAMCAAVDYAAAASDAQAADAEAAICAAKHFAGLAGKAVADSSLQMHGAIGYTMEFPLHLLMRRVFRLGASFGSTRDQGECLFEIFKQAH